MDSFQDILDTVKARKPRKQHEFQQYGLMLAEKLGDPKRISLYMKLAKEQPREVLDKALRLTLDAKERRGQLGRLFLWQLKEVKKEQMKRIFVGLFPATTKDRQKLEGHWLSPLVRYLKGSQSLRPVGAEQLHLTMFFADQFPADQVAVLQEIVKVVKSKYALPQEVELASPWVKGDHMIISSSKSQLLYRIFYTLKKEIPAQTGQGKEYFHGQPLFHLTLGRGRVEGWLTEHQDDVKVLYPSDNLTIAMDLLVVESRLTKDGYQYRILR